MAAGDQAGQDEIQRLLRTGLQLIDRPGCNISINFRAIGGDNLGRRWDVVGHHNILKIGVAGIAHDDFIIRIPAEELFRGAVIRDVNARLVDYRRALRSGFGRV